MGTESSRGSLTGAAAAPACPSVVMSGLLRGLFFLPLPAFSSPSGPRPPAAPRAKAQAHLAPVGPPTFLQLRFHAPALAQAQNCPPSASVSGLQLRRRKVSAALVP